MKTRLVIVLAFTVFVTASSSPYDDGKYYPKRYRLDGLYDDGRYYRPSNEGKYVPGDEGRYTYIYRQFIDGDYRYLHRDGPGGPDGGGAGDYGVYAEKYGYVHRVGPDGLGGPGGPGGPGGGLGHGGGSGPGGPRGPGGVRPDGHDVDWYQSADEAEGSEHYYTKMTVGQLKSIVCSSIEDKNNTLLMKKIPDVRGAAGERVVSLYKMKGTKKVSGGEFSRGKNVAFKYEIVVSVIEEDDHGD